MSINSFSAPLSLTNKASFQKKLLIIVPHFFALFLIGVTKPISIYFSLFIIILIGASVIYYYRLHISRKLARSVYEISQDSAKNWLISTQNNEPKQVTLLDSSFASNFLIVINYIDIKNNKYVVVFTPDSLSVNDFRHLIVRLRMT